MFSFNVAAERWTYLQKRRLIRKARIFAINESAECWLIISLKSSRKRNIRALLWLCDHLMADIQALGFSLVAEDHNISNEGRHCWWDFSQLTYLNTLSGFETQNWLFRFNNFNEARDGKIPNEKSNSTSSRVIVVVNNLHAWHRRPKVVTNPDKFSLLIRKTTLGV